MNFPYSMSPLKLELVNHHVKFRLKRAQSDPDLTFLSPLRFRHTAFVLGSVQDAHRASSLEQLLPFTYSASASVPKVMSMSISMLPITTTTMVIIMIKLA